MAVLGFYHSHRCCPARVRVQHPRALVIRWLLSAEPRKLRQASDDVTCFRDCLGSKFALHVTRLLSRLDRLQALLLPQRLSPGSRHSLPCNSPA